MNISDQASFASLYQKRHKQAWIEHFHNLGFNVALTLSWNGSRPLDIAKSHLRTVNRNVDHTLLGCRFNLKPKAERAFAVFVFEGLGPCGHLHAHSLWRLRKPKHLLKFARLFPGERGGSWNRIVRSGSYKLDLVDDPVVFAGYALKAQHIWSDDREMIWSDEFYK
jgi:hypothetical protein